MNDEAPDVDSRLKEMRSELDEMKLEHKRLIAELDAKVRRAVERKTEKPPESRCDWDWGL